MKKRLYIVLVFLLVLGLCACGEKETGKTATPAEGVQVVYSKVNITPDYLCGMGGYSDQEKRLHTGLVDYIYATCIAVTSGEETILLFTIDIGGMNEDRQNTLRGPIALTTGIPEEKFSL